MSTLHGKFCGIMCALQTYEHSIIGYPHPMKIFCDNKTLLYIWARKGTLSHRFFHYQVLLTHFNVLQLMRTPGKVSTFPNLPPRNVSLKDLNGHQLAQKEIPKGIRFLKQRGREVQYQIDHNSSIPLNALS